MHRKNVFALCGLVAASVLLWTQGALASSTASASSTPTVTVRVEGIKRTLLTPTLVHLHGGSITRFGAPSGSCPATSAAGALDRATHHHWVGAWSPSFADYEITSILGERHSFTSKDYWEVVVNDKPASVGVCALPSHTGERLLFAAVPDKNGIEYPIVLSVLGHPTSGQPFEVKAFSLKRGKKAVAGALVSGSGVLAHTDSHGIATITPSHAGTLVLKASAKKYIRSAPLTVTVA